MGIFVKPECLDYWMMPDEEFEIRAELSSPGDEFELVLHEDGVAVWPSHGVGEITVHKGDNRAWMQSPAPQRLAASADLTSRWISRRIESSGDAEPMVRR
jgi:hypothetical protein